MRESAARSGLVNPQLSWQLATMRKLILLPLLLPMLATAAAAKPIWVTQEFQGGQCKDLESGDVDTGQDYIVRQCRSFPGVSTFVVYNEGVRLSVGFGLKPHTSLQYADARRGDWPVDWGGEKKNGKFVPKVAIARFRSFSEEGGDQYLAVFRLLDNGMSCIVGNTKNNTKARAIAIAAMAKWTCQSEAQPLD
jgi:hypothetical protein